MQSPCTRAAAALNRREFIAASTGVLAWAAARGADPAPGADSAPPARARVVRTGLVGCGTRGTGLAERLHQHGGFQVTAVADYFPEVSAAAGAALGVPAERCFSGLGGFRKVIASGVEAVVLMAPTYFLPEHAAAATAAGVHVFLAAPVAVDAAGVRTCAEAAGQCARAKKAFLVDLPLLTEPVNAEVVKRIRDGGLAPLAYVTTSGISHGYPDPAREATMENRLREQVWVNDVALGGDYVVNFDLPVFEAVIRALGRAPVAASGRSRICRPDPHGDSRDVYHITWEFADGLIATHIGQAIRNNAGDVLQAQFYSARAYGQVNFWGRSFLRGGAAHFGGGDVKNLYVTGQDRLVAAFHDAILRDGAGAPEFEPMAQAHYMAMLGRDAAARNDRLTMEAWLKEDRRLTANLTGLKA